MDQHTYRLILVWLERALPRNRVTIVQHPGVVMAEAATLHGAAGAKVTLQVIVACISVSS